MNQQDPDSHSTSTNEIGAHAHQHFSKDEDEIDLSNHSGSEEYEDELADDEAEQQKIMDKRQKKRFGHIIQKDRYKISNMLKIVAIVLAIIVIPLQVFLKSVLEEKENEQLESLQKKYLEDIWQIKLISMLLVIGDVNFTLFAGMMLFLISDSLIAFKTSMIYCFGLYLIVILKLFYESPRPFWNSKDIITYQNYCDFDFSCPGNHVFSLTFFWTYTIFMYFQKYTVSINWKLVWTLYTILAVLSAVSIFGTFLFGINYLYQSSVSLLYTMTFFIIVVNFDAQILTLCEQIGFIVRSSRKYKFYLLFISIGLFVIGLILLDNNQMDWSDQQIWIINVSNIETCKKQLNTMGATQLGIQSTFNLSSILFFLVGMGFGCSYSLVEVDCINWVKTSLSKRIMRTLLGGILAVLMFYGFKAINFKDQPFTNYIICELFPSFIIPFMIYGPFLVLCQRIRLVDTQYGFARSFSRDKIPQIYIEEVTI